MINLTERNRILAVTRPEEISSGDACAFPAVRRRRTSECIRRVPADTRACFSDRGLNEIRDGNKIENISRAQTRTIRRGGGGRRREAIRKVRCFLPVSYLEVDYFPAAQDRDAISLIGPRRAVAIRCERLIKKLIREANSRLVLICISN